MNTLNRAETIVAVATAQVEGAIAIIRLSGTDAIAIADKVYRGQKQLRFAKSHTIHYGRIYDNFTDEPIDEVLVSVFRAPKTYTREDIVEINCHGGVAVTQEILHILLQNGAELASPGEFTKRAFLNGRIDLTQAEAVADLISAENKQAVQLAVHTLDGKLAQQIKDFREQTVDILATIEVNIDYPEYDDVETLTHRELVPKITKLITAMEQLLRTANTGQVIKNGLRTAIIGRPNVGKSSLLNALLREQKAIVTDVAGTTRDIVEGSIRLNDITLNVIDTAGIRQTEDIVERIGIEKAQTVLAEADLVLLVLDESRELNSEDEALLELAAKKRTIIVLNKTDLVSKLIVPEQYQMLPQVKISAQNDVGIDALYDALEGMLNIDLTGTNQVYLSNIRHIQLLNQAKNDLNQAKSSALSGLPIDIITIDLQSVYRKLGEILGIEIQDELLNTLFSQFCLGK